MKKKLALFAIFPMVLTACTNHLQEVEIATDNENSNWEHSTPILKPVELKPEISLSTPVFETGWIPHDTDTLSAPIVEASTVAPNGYSSTTISESPVELKPVVSHRVVKDDIYTAAIQNDPEVVRYDRYLLVDAKPESGQKYLLEQMVNVNITGYGLTVEEGMWKALSNTGYALCSPFEPSVRSLFSLQLPKVHYKFGPTKLREAMQMLAGGAYELTVNDAIRQVCYRPRSGIPEMPTPKNVVFLDTELH